MAASSLQVTPGAIRTGHWYSCSTVAAKPGTPGKALARRLAGYWSRRAVPTMSGVVWELTAQPCHANGWTMLIASVCPLVPPCVMRVGNT